MLQVALDNGCGIFMSEQVANERKFVSADFDKCTGCRVCELVCALENENVFDPKLSRIKVLPFHLLVNMPMSCRFCEDAPCVRSCSRKALTQSEETGVIIVDDDSSVNKTLSEMISRFYSWGDIISFTDALKAVSTAPYSWIKTKRRLWPVTCAMALLNVLNGVLNQLWVWWLKKKLRRKPEKLQLSI